MAPGDGILLETKICCRYRGEYLVGVKKITITDPFRLISFTFKNPEPLLVNVRPEKATDEGMEKEVSAEEFLESHIDPDRLDVLNREYVPGDDRRTINWKASARMDKLFVRTLTGEEKRGILLIPDTKRYSDDKYKYIPDEHRIIKMILDMSIYYVRQDIPVSLFAVTGGDRVLCTTVSSETGFQEYVDRVSSIVFDESEEGKGLLQMLMENRELLRDNTCFVITSEKNDTFELISDYFEKSGKNVKVVAVGETDER